MNSCSRSYFLSSIESFKVKRLKDIFADSQCPTLTGGLACLFKSTYRFNAFGKKLHVSERIILHCFIWHNPFSWM